MDNIKTDNKMGDLIQPIQKKGTRIYIWANICSVKKFIKLWQRADTVKDLIEYFNVPACVLRGRACYLRKLGINLKKLSHREFGDTTIFNLERYAKRLMEKQALKNKTTGNQTTI